MTKTTIITATALACIFNSCSNELSTEPRTTADIVLTLRAEGYTLADICFLMDAQTDSEVEEIEAYFNL